MVNMDRDCEIYLPNWEKLLNGRDAFIKTGKYDSDFGNQLVQIWECRTDESCKKWTASESRIGRKS